MIVFAVLLIFCFPLLYALCEYFHHVFTLKRYPAGPFPLPVIGNLNLITPDSHKDFRELAKKYGDVFGLSLGMNRLVIVNAIEPAREALTTKGADFAGRGKSLSLDMLTRGYKDMVFADYGPFWKHQRKLMHTALASYGEGTGTIDEKIEMESEALNERLRDANGKPVDIHSEFGNSIINVICAISFGQRYEMEDEDFRQILDFSNLIVEALGNGDPVAFLPWLRFFPMKNLVKLKKGIVIRDALMRRKLIEHKETFDPEVVRDFTDSLLKTARDKSLFQDMDAREGIEEYLDLLLSDMVIAGSETTTSVLRWLIVYLLHWPHLQTEVYNEIVKVIGTQRYPELNDQQNLPLCQATIQEALRLSSVAPLGLPRASVKDSSIGGKNVPKDTGIFFNLWNINRDAREYSDPDVFNPHRWLDENGEFNPKKHRSFLPFSAGRRVCVGENLARKEIFLIFTRFVRDFRVEVNKDEEFPSLEGVPRITLAPKPFTAVFTARH